MVEYRVRILSLRRDDTGLSIRSSVTTDDINTFQCIDESAPPDAIGVVSLTAPDGMDTLAIARKGGYFSLYSKNLCIMSGKGTVTRPTKDNYFIHNYNDMAGTMIVDLGGGKAQIIADIKPTAAREVDMATFHTVTTNFVWSTFMRDGDIVVWLTTMDTDQYKEFTFPRKGATKVLTVIPHGDDKDAIYIVTDAKHKDNTPVFCLHAFVAMTVTVHQNKQAKARYNLAPNDCELKVWDDEGSRLIKMNSVIAAKSNATAAVFLVLHGDEQNETASFLFVDKMDGMSRIVSYARLTNNSDVPPSKCEIRDVRVKAFSHPDGTLINYRANVILRMPSGQIATWLGNFTLSDGEENTYNHHYYVDEGAIDSCFCAIDMATCNTTPHMVELGFAERLLRQAMTVAVEGSERMAAVTDYCHKVDKQLETAKQELEEAAFTTATFANSAARSETERQLEANARAKAMQSLLLMEQEVEKKIEKATAALNKKLIKAQKQVTVRDAEHKVSQITLKTEHKEIVDDLTSKHKKAMHELAIKHKDAMQGLEKKHKDAMVSMTSRNNDALASRGDDKVQLKLLANKNKTLLDSMAALVDQNKTLENQNKTLLDSMAALVDQNKTLEDQNKTLEDKNKTLEDTMTALEKELSGTICDLMSELDIKRTRVEELLIENEKKLIENEELLIETEKDARQEMSVGIKPSARRALTVEIENRVRQELSAEIKKHKQQAANEFQARMTAEQAAEQERARMLQERAVLTRDAYHAGWHSAMQPVFYQQAVQQGPHQMVYQAI